MGAWKPKAENGECSRPNYASDIITDKVLLGEFPWMVLLGE